MSSGIVTEMIDLLDKIKRHELQLWTLIDAQHELKSRVNELYQGYVNDDSRTLRLLETLDWLMGQYEAQTWQIVTFQLHIRLKLVELKELGINSTIEPEYADEQMNEELSQTAGMEIAPPSIESSNFIRIASITAAYVKHEIDVVPSTFDYSGCKQTSSNNHEASSVQMMGYPSGYELNGENTLTHAGHESSNVEPPPLDPLSDKESKGNMVGGLHSCRFCPMEFRLSEELIWHFRKCHTFAKPFACDRCEKEYITIHKLRAHQQAIHSAQSPELKCNECQKNFSRSDALERHKRIHTVEKTFICKVCQRPLANLHGLKIHMRLHDGDKPFTCGQCEKKYTTLYKLKSHQQIFHSDQPPAFKCDLCEKVFRRSDFLERHKRCHTGVKLYSCDVCQKTFNRSDILDRHKRTHTGVLPFECDVCQRRFTDKRNMHRHRMKHAK